MRRCRPIQEDLGFLPSNSGGRGRWGKIPQQRFQRSIRHPQASPLSRLAALARDFSRFVPTSTIPAGDQTSGRRPPRQHQQGRACKKKWPPSSNLDRRPGNVAPAPWPSPPLPRHPHSRGSGPAPRTLLAGSQRRHTTGGRRLEIQGPPRESRATRSPPLPSSTTARLPAASSGSGEKGGGARRGAAALGFGRLPSRPEAERRGGQGLSPVWSYQIKCTTCAYYKATMATK
jgi:hypothetical protein